MSGERGEHGELVNLQVFSGDGAVAASGPERLYGGASFVQEGVPPPKRKVQEQASEEQTSEEVSESKSKTKGRKKLKEEKSADEEANTKEKPHEAEADSTQVKLSTPEVKKATAERFVKKVYKEVADAVKKGYGTELSAALRRGKWMHRRGGLRVGPLCLSACLAACLAVHLSKYI
eukprot:GHVU01143948.1.p1 GENE.GHVU01143948.1~~GHVU01143948.1.p1  ORF type:complete len:176 (+),score=32.03 GHVU01143948.1:1607-2134(+)